MTAEEEAQFEEVSSMFRTIIKGVTHKFNRIVGSDLSYPQFKVLYSLSRHGPQKVSDLAGTLCITPAAVTGHTVKLLAEGYVTRERNEQDRRVVYISITEKGNDLIRRIRETQKETIHSFFNVLPEEDIQHLKRIFAAMLSKIDI